MPFQNPCFFAIYHLKILIRTVCKRYPCFLLRKRVLLKVRLIFFCVLIYLFLLFSLQVDVIADHTSFQKMKENPATNMSDLDYLKYNQKGTSFQRKGIVGGWKEYFSKDQSDYLEQKVQKKLSGTGLKFEYEI